ncbi:MAG: Rieske (2Fe-2S) protein [Sphingomonadales bacterium]|nr:Rieske (2Fe-2S) protein [Sphingomonadales bacterium]
MTDAPALHLAGIYRRQVHASLERIWENVFDWEHLAHLHDGSFADCALIDAGPWGWRVVLTPKGAASQLIEMRADRANGRYTSTTIEGTGVGTEIRVALSPCGSSQVDVTVEFHLPEARKERLAVMGDAYVAAYARLWDEDEAMMQARERALAGRRPPNFSVPRLDLGEKQAVRAALPLKFDFGEAPFRLVELDGKLVVHSTVCPHWLGPLDEAPVILGQVRCPWHGYRFYVANGACAAHPALKLGPAPKISLIEGRVVVAWPAGAGA